MTKIMNRWTSSQRRSHHVELRDVPQHCARPAPPCASCASCAWIWDIWVWLFVHSVHCEHMWTHVPNKLRIHGNLAWQRRLAQSPKRMDRCQNSGKGRLYQPDRLQIVPPTVEQVCSHFAPECTSEVHATSVCGNTCCCNTCTVSAMISLAGRTWEIAVQCWSTVWTDHWNIGNMQLLHPRFNTLELHSPHFTSITIAKLLTIGILLGYLTYDQTGMMKYDDWYTLIISPSDIPICLSIVNDDPKNFNIWQCVKTLVPSEPQNSW